MGRDGLAEGAVTLGGSTNQHEESGGTGGGGGEVPRQGRERNCQHSELCSGKVVIFGGIYNKCNNL